MEKSTKSVTKILLKEVEDEAEFVYKLVGTIGLIRETVGQLIANVYKFKPSVSYEEHHKELTSILTKLNIGLSSAQIRFLSNSVKYYFDVVNDNRNEFKIYGHDKYTDDFRLSEINFLIHQRELRKLILSQSLKSKTVNRRKNIGQ
jgi:hypothetical protein